MVSTLIQKRNALYLKIPFIYGIVCSNDIYKGYQVEITDIESTGFYVCRVMQAFNQRVYKNYRPHDVLPDNRDQGTVEKIRSELDIVLNNQGYFSTLNDNDIIIVEKLRSIFRGKGVTELFRYFYNPVDYNEKEIGKQFLTLIFEKIKKQFDNLAIIGMGEDIDLDDQLDDIMDEVMSFDQIQHTSTEVEYLPTEINRILRNALVLLNLPSDALFVNLHSQRLENIIQASDKIDINTYKPAPMVVAYIFVHLNESGSQINYDDLIGIKTSELPKVGNDNPTPIIYITSKFGIIKEHDKENVEYYISIIIDHLGITIVPPVIRKRVIAPIKRKPIQKTVNKTILLLPQPIKEYIKEPILWYIKDKIKTKIDNYVSPQIYKDLLSYFNGNRSALRMYPKSSENYTLYIQPFIKEYTDRIDNTEQLVKDKLKVHSNLIKNLKSPEKNDIKNAIKELIKEKINSSILQEKENKILNILLANFDNTEKIYSLIGNPNYYDVIKKYLIEYENALNGAIQLNNKIGELAFRETINREIVVKSNMNKVIKELKNEYRKKLQDNEILYEKDLKDLQSMEFNNFKNSGIENQLQAKVVKELREKYKSNLNKKINVKVNTEILKNLNVISGYTDSDTQLIKYQLMLNKEYKSYSNENFDYKKYIQEFIEGTDEDKKKPIEESIGGFVPKRYQNKLNLNELKKLSKQEIKIKQRNIDQNEKELNLLEKQISVLQVDSMKNRLNKIKSPKSKKIMNSAITELQKQLEKLNYIKDLKIPNIKDLIERFDQLLYEKYEMIIINELQKVFTNFKKYDKELIQRIYKVLPISTTEKILKNLYVKFPSNLNEYEISILKSAKIELAMTNKNKAQMKTFIDKLLGLSKSDILKIEEETKHRSNLLSNLDFIKSYTNDEIQYKTEIIKIKESFDKKEKSIIKALPIPKNIETIKQEKGILKTSMNYKLYTAILLSFNSIIGYSLKDTNTIKYQLLIHEESKKGTDLNKFIAKNIPKEYHNKLNVNSIKKYTKFDIAYKNEILKIKGLFTNKEKNLRKELTKSKSKSKTKSKKLDLFEHLLNIKKVQVEIDITNCIKNSKHYTKKEKEFFSKNIYKIKDLIAIKQLRLNTIEDTNESKLIKHLIQYHQLYRSKVMDIAKIIRSKI